MIQPVHLEMNVSLDELTQLSKINITDNRHFALIYLLGITRLTFTRSTAQEPSIYVGPRNQDWVVLASAKKSKWILNYYHLWSPFGNLTWMIASKSTLILVSTLKKVQNTPFPWETRYEETLRKLLTWKKLSVRLDCLMT